MSRFLEIAFVKCKMIPFTTSMNESLLFFKMMTNDEEKIIVQST